MGTWLTSYMYVLCNSELKIVHVLLSVLCLKCLHDWFVLYVPTTCIYQPKAVSCLSVFLDKRSREPTTFREDLIKTFIFLTFPKLFLSKKFYSPLRQICCSECWWSNCTISLHSKWMFCLKREKKNLFSCYCYVYFLVDLVTIHLLIWLR